MRQKWHVLSGQLKAAGMYAPERIKAKLLEKSFHSGYAVMQETCEISKDPADRIIKAFGALWPTWLPAYWEIGTLFVHEKHRGNGLLSEVMDELRRRSPCDCRLFFITKEERVMRLASERGFFPITTETHPDILLWASSAGMVCRLPKSVYPIAPGTWGTPQAKERWLFMQEGN